MRNIKLESLLLTFARSTVFLTLYTHLKNELALTRARGPMHTLYRPIKRD